MLHKGKKRIKDGEFPSDKDSDDSGRAAAPKKRTKKSNKVEDGAIVCELSKTRKVKVKTFKSRILIDIREYYYTDSGVSEPRKKGISLTEDQWNTLRDHVKDIDGAIAGLKQ